MRLQTEAFNGFNGTGFLLLAIIMGVIAVLICLVCIATSDSSGKRAFFWGLLVFDGLFLVINCMSASSPAVREDQLNADLKSQLGIEKVSYSDDYRQLTGEKDGTLVTCFLAEEGDRGNVYEVICK